MTVRETDLDGLLDVALATPGADEVEVSARRSSGGLTRFARSGIHQHVAQEDTGVAVRVVVDGRIGTASTNDASAKGVATTARRALEAAHLTPPDPDYAGLAGAAPLPTVRGRFDDATAEATPATRAQAVATLLGRLRTGQVGAGAVETSATDVAFATTVGARHRARSTRASASTVVMAGGASGHAEDAGAALGDLDPADVGERAAATAAAAADPGHADPGTWEVVLLPSGVTTLLEFLAFTTFSGKAVAEGRSAFSDRLGQTVASPSITIADDPVGDGAIGMPFDGEGMPRRRVELIVDGVATAVVHDRASAARAGVESTGHALPAPNPWGALARHLVLEPGDQRVDDLVAGVERGLLVTRFWYARTVNPKQTVITGMTRDGTFLIEGGAVAGPVRNLRFNQSILEALSSCDGVGDRLHTCGDELGDSRAPALRLRSFTFSSASDH